MNNIFSFLIKQPPYSFYTKKNKNIIRVHITKTAGTSLQRAMKFYTPNKKKGIKKHYFAREIIDLVGKEKWDKSFTFTFVRNPWDRLFSLYRYEMRKNKILSEKDGNTFAKWLKNEINEMYKSPYHKSLPQVDWLVDFEGKINIDFIGMFEQLEHDTEKLGKILNINIRLPHINQSLPRLDYKTAYNKELENLIYKHYQKDIETFGYSF